MESVESRAKEALEAYLKCNETVKSVYYKKICDHDCDNCNLNYAQGTYGDHKEAVKTAIQALEKQIGQTNADRIRNMSDEELAEFLCKVKSDYQLMEHEFPSEEEQGEWEDWLQSE